MSVNGNVMVQHRQLVHIVYTSNVLIYLASTVITGTLPIFNVAYPT